jgi:hypothetical protein
MRALCVVLTAILFAGCSREEARLAESGSSDFRAVALEFTKALATRDYDGAYAMTSRDFQSGMSKDQMQAAFEAIVPLDWGAVGPIETGETLASWPGKQPADLGWVYVSIGGDVYSEALIVIVALEDGNARIREVEFGRP